MAVIFHHLTALRWLYIAVLSFGISRASAQAPTILLEDGKVWVRNLHAEVLYTYTRYHNSQADWREVFPVSVKETTNGILIPGTYQVFEDAVSFSPRFPFAPDVQYTASFFTEELAINPNEVYLPETSTDKLTLDFTIKSTLSDLPQLLQIQPSIDTVPANLLKFHLTFSKPMALGQVYEKVKIFGASGEVIEKPFLVVDQELWDKDMKAVTILFDPGRIKRGLRPNLEMKPPLVEGESYHLVVEQGWIDCNGLRTSQRYTKKFVAGPADRISPDAREFVVVAPASDTSPVIVDFGESMDAITLQNGIRVLDGSGAEVAGKIRIRPKESAVEFVPKNPWLPSRYTILMNDRIEDLAGNNLNRLFDEDVSANSRQKSVSNQQTFTVAKAKK